MNALASHGYPNVENYFSMEIEIIWRLPRTHSLFMLVYLLLLDQGNSIIVAGLRHNANLAKFCEIDYHGFFLTLFRAVRDFTFHRCTNRTRG